MLNRRVLVNGALAAVAGGWLALSPTVQADEAADAEWQKVLAEAKGQDLNMLLQPSEAFEAVVRIFQEKFPDIRVQTTIIHPSQGGPRVVTEQSNGLFIWDTWWSTASNMNNVVLPIDGFEKITDYMILPEVKDESHWHNPSYLYTSDRGPYVFVHTHYLQTLALYNRDLVPGGELELDTLLDPSLKGKIAIRVPSRPHGGTMMLAQIAKEKGDDFVKRLLTEMEPVFVDNDRQVTMGVMRGDYAAGIGTTDELYFECVKEGGCVNIELFPVSFMHSRGVAVFKNAPHKAATKVWVNWILSKEGQETYVEEWAKQNAGGAFSMRKDVEGDPRHVGSQPEFENLDQYVAVSLDSGTAELARISELYRQAARQ